MPKKFLALLGCVLTFGVLNLSGSAQAALDSNLSEITSSSLDFLEAAQVRKTDGVYVAGEWQAQVYSSPIALMFGVGNLFEAEEEPSAFTTGSIMNQLAHIYKSRPELSEKLRSIPTMIKRATGSLDRYREGELYNFYPPRMWRGVRVHQAASMSLTPLWKGFTNIPQDSDTSSVTYAARFYERALQNRSFAVPNGALKAFATFRDLKRDAHYYNARDNMENTGAFLTWLYDENNPDMPRFYFAEPEAGVRIPFNRNDVDCVVNLNVLRFLALTGNSRLKGRKQACAAMQEVIREERYATCGIYYPNTYNFVYSAAMADSAGEKCLKPQASAMVEFILKNQTLDGGWYNHDNLHKDDRVHATAFALHGLVQFGSVNDAKVRRAVLKGYHFLLAKIERDERGRAYWEGEVFFTATAIARALVDWRSDAFTTSVALSALLEADRYLDAKGTRIPKASNLRLMSR